MVNTSNKALFEKGKRKVMLKNKIKSGSKRFIFQPKSKTFNYGYLYPFKNSNLMAFVE